MTPLDHQLVAVIREFFGRDLGEISPATSLKDLPGWDSIMHVKLMKTLEAEFDVRFTVRDMVKMTTIDEVKTILEGKSFAARQ